MKEFLNKALIERLQWAIDSSIDENTNKIIDKKDLFVQVSMIIIAIWQEGFVFKHSSFAEEREWRIYKYTTSENYDFAEGIDNFGYSGFLDGVFSSNEKHMGDYTRSKLKFRDSSNNILPYFEIGFDKCKDKLVKQIVLGPKCNIDMLDLKMLLA